MNVLIKCETESIPFGCHRMRHLPNCQCKTLATLVHEKHSHIIGECLYILTDPRLDVVNNESDSLIATIA